jgi:hypothetical protein
MPSPGRLQTPELNINQPIQPAGIPGDTYIRPPAPPATNDLLQVAEALGSVHSGLKEFAAAEKQRTAKTTADERLKGLDEIAVNQAKMTPAEFNKYIGGKVQDGSLPQASRDAYAAAGVLSAANEYRTAAANWYDTSFDREHGDILSGLQQFRASQMGQFKDPALQAAFARATDPINEQLIAGHQKVLEQRLGEQRITSATDNYELVAEAALAHGTGTEIVSKHLAQSSNDLKKTLKLTGPENDEALMRLANHYATQGRDDVVKAILDTPRGGRGSLLFDSETSAKAWELLQKAHKMAADTQVQDQPIKAGDFEARVAHGDATDAEIAASPYHTAEQKAQLTQQAHSARMTRADQAQKQIEEQQAVTASGRPASAPRPPSPIIL